MLRRGTILAILISTFSITALADTSGTETLKGVSAFSLDIGAVVNTGGDIRWNGTMLTLQAA
jgi:hypothetical protein